MTIELSEYVIDAIADAVVKKMQEQKTGRWIVEDYGNSDEEWFCCSCSNCKDYYTRDWKEMKFCPNCGAKMESEGC